MKPKPPKYNPFVRKNDSLLRVMADVVVALIPAMLLTTIAYGWQPLLVIGVSVGTALATEFISGWLLYRDGWTIRDGSAVVTGLLMAFTIGPFTPLPVVAFGAACAILFGKMLWGGVGRNLFNPALMGREFMTIVFPVLMVSEGIYFRPEAIQVQEVFWFDTHFVNQLIYQSSGAMGEYSVLLLALGGLWLLYRRRISWHIPVAMMVAFSLLLFLLPDKVFLFSLGGVFLGSIYMATDMPTSSSTPAGKLYFGAMIGIICIICLASGIFRGYLSYAILLMNLFVTATDSVFRPVVWGHKMQLLRRLGRALLLTAVILLSSWAVVWLHHAEAIKYLIYLYALGSIGKFILIKRQVRSAHQELNS